MSRIGRRFAELKKKSEKALVCFVTAGDPDLPTTRLLALELERAGADALELNCYLIPTNDTFSGDRIEQGYQFIACSLDTWFIIHSCRSVLRGVTEDG